jgi:catechol 2,3-dioxygenase-like lactoylglutathione lyase family enzyme
MAPQLHLTEIGRVALPSPDQEKALEFYRDTLGFEVRMDESFADGQMRWIEVVPPGSSTAVAIAPPGPNSSGPVEADHQALKDAGVDVDDEIMRNTPPVPPMFGIRDPNGNSLLIVQPLQ